MEQNKNYEQKSKSKSNASKNKSTKQSFPPVYLKELLDDETVQRLLNLKNPSSK